MDSEKVTPINEPTAAVGARQAAICADGFHTFMAGGHALIDGCHAVNGEMLAFWQSRLKDGLATGQRLLECSSAEAALEIQLDYAKAALQAYLDQCAKISGLITQSFLPAKPSSREDKALAA